MVMDEFETIILDTKECKICKQQTGEELISCILHENLASSEESASETSRSNGGETFAHRICLERWDAVMKSSIYPHAQHKKTWKDRLMGLITVGQASSETWTPVRDLNLVNRSTSTSKQPSFKDEQNNKLSTASQNVGHSVFHESKEAYCVENVGNDSGQWRTSKVRIRSVDLEDEESTAVPRPISSISTATSCICERNFIRHTRATLEQCDLIQLKETVEDLKMQINNMSSELVAQLEEKDSLLLQKHSMKVSVGQLISLQANVKTASTQNVSRSATSSTRTFQDTLPCT